MHNHQFIALWYFKDKDKGNDKDKDILFQVYKSLKHV